MREDPLLTVRATLTKAKQNQQKGKREKRRKIKRTNKKQKVAPKGAIARKMDQKAMENAASFFEEPVAERMVLPARSPEWRLATQDD